MSEYIEDKIIRRVSFQKKKQIVKETQEEVENVFYKISFPDTFVKEIPLIKNIEDKILNDEYKDFKDKLFVFWFKISPDLYILNLFEHDEKQMRDMVRQPSHYFTYKNEHKEEIQKRLLNYFDKTPIIITEKIEQPITQLPTITKEEQVALKMLKSKDTEDIKKSFAELTEYLLSLVGNELTDQDLDTLLDYLNNIGFKNNELEIIKRLK